MDLDPIPPRLNLSLHDAEETFKNLVTRFSNYLDRDGKDNEDANAITKLIRVDPPGLHRNRLIVNLNNVRQYDRQLAQLLLESPMDSIPAFARALKEHVIIQSKISLNSFNLHCSVGFIGSFGAHHTNPRTLTASNIGTMVALEGIIARCSLVRPKMIKSIHYCEKTQLFHSREYRDATMLGEGLPTGTTYPTQDDNGNPLTTEFGFCTFRDHQSITLQEMPERAPPGLLPRSIDVILDDDLVDACKPGDRVQIVGVYRAVSGGVATGTFRAVILANNVRQLDKEVAFPTLTASETRAFRTLTKRKDVDIVDLLTRSLAPSIFGHYWVKRALLLLLLGGMEVNTDNGTHIRGDINILLLGDPSTAKSQFLRFILQMAPLAIATTGRGSSGVGLTAAVTHDQETGERRLEAGAMVLADRGVVCIDEFDKMSDGDRVAIHEVMEQQTITIAKAGIHTSLNARCSVVAAANPTYGQYDEKLEPHRNIRLPDSLLSRFDLLFVILDKTDEATDRQLSMHVLRMHRHLPPGIEEGQPLPQSMLDPHQLWLADGVGTVTSASSGEIREEPAFEDAPIYQQTISSSQSNLVNDTRVTTRKMNRRAEARTKILSLGTMKKYLHYAKSRYKPKLTEVAAEIIEQTYADFRNAKANEQDRRRTLPITARTLETLIRLATAHAKARLSQLVEEQDAAAACDLVEYALFKEFRRVRKPSAASKLKRRKVEEDEDDSEEGQSDDDTKDKDDNATIPLNNLQLTQNEDETMWTADVTSSQATLELTGLVNSLSQLSTTSAAVEGMNPDIPMNESLGMVTDSSNVDTNVLIQFKLALDRVFQDLGDSVAASDLPQLIVRAANDIGSPVKFTPDLVTTCLSMVEEEDAVMVSEGVIYRV